MEKVKKIDFLIIFALLAFFFGILFTKHAELFKYKFNLGVVSDYLRSQDIEDVSDQIKDRIFVSDENIYLASGYLYTKGEDPTNYNFQHPPLIKYLFGYSTLIFGNPYIVQFTFGAVFIFLTYFLGLKLFDQKVVPIIASTFLILDPVFMEQISQTLLDLGQAVFALLYYILVVFTPESFILQGMVLGLFAASKFWSTAIIFVFLLWGYRKFLLKKKVDFKKLAYSFLIAFFVFLIFYSKTFIDRGFFNIFLFEGRVLRFMLEHNSSPIIGGSILLYLTGHFVKWWGVQGFSKASPFNILWPISFIVALTKVIFAKKREKVYLVSFIPILYLLLTATQVPFTRYFVIVLPFFYLSLSETIVKAFNKYLLR